MRRAVASFALVIACAAVLCACGSATPKSQRAKADARAACVDMLGLGREIDLRQSVLSTSALSVMAHARADADDAYALDARWSSLHDSLRIIDSSLLNDQRTTLGATLADFAVECEPAVGVRPNS